jgi:DNA repair exonuclease SbcCD nuclease subunit
MRLLLFSDLHLDTHFKFAGAGARLRRIALRATLGKVMALAQEQSVDAVLCGGDLYEHDRCSPDTAAFLRTTFEAVELPVFLAPGNHDWYSSASPYHQVDWSPNVHVFTSDRLEPLPLADGLTLWGAAHRAPANTDGFLDDFRVDRGGINVALFHGSERGALRFQESGKAPHAPFRAEQIEAAGLDHAMLGHFHAPRDGLRHTYPGNPDPLSFGESPGRGVVVFDIADNGQISQSRYSVATSEVHDVTVSLDGVTSASDIGRRVADAVAPMSGSVRVTLVGEVAPEVDVTDGLGGVDDGRFAALIVRAGAVTVGYDFDVIRAEATVRGQFVRDVLDAPDLDHDTRRRVLITGMRALDGRDQELDVR